MGRGATVRTRVTKKAVADLLRDGRTISKDEAAGEIAVMLESELDPNISDIARRSGMSQDFVRGVRDQLGKQGLLVKMEIRKITAKQMLAKAETIIDMSMEQIAHILPHANTPDDLKPLAQAMSAAFNIRQLLRGEPTSISTFEDRRTLNELLPAMLREAARRGVIIEGIAKPVVEPQRGLPESRLTHQIEEAELLAGSDAVRDGIDVGPPFDDKLEPELALESVLPE